VEQAPAPAPVPMEPAPAPATAPALVRHTMVTRLRNAITKPVILTDGTIRYEYKHRAFLAAPASYRTALGDACWRAAMEDEHSALLRNGTWTLVPRPPGQNVIGSRLVFKVKQKADGSVDKFKARLVTQGFTQRCGVDYFDTYSPVVKPVTVRPVLAIALSHNWSVQQVDISNAFLHGILEETAYMCQPPSILIMSANCTSQFMDASSHHELGTHVSVTGFINLVSLQQNPTAPYLSSHRMASLFTCWYMSMTSSLLAPAPEPRLVSFSS